MLRSVAFLLFLLPAIIWACDSSSSSSGCLNGGVCGGVSAPGVGGSVSGSASVCICPAGLTGDQCEININDCDPNPCANGVCADGLNAFVCVCNPGFTGTQCEFNVNDCAGAPCGAHGKCVDGIDAFFCVCDAGWGGASCEIDLSVEVDVDVDVNANVEVSACASIDCGLNGYCNAGICICNAGFNGDRCQINIDDCAGVSCGPYGHCVDGNNHYCCVCEMGWAGERCEINIETSADVCATILCAANQYCLDGICYNIIENETGGTIVVDDYHYEQPYTPPPAPIFEYDYYTDVDAYADAIVNGEVNNYPQPVDYVPTINGGGSSYDYVPPPEGGEWVPVYTTTTCQVPCRWIGRDGCGGSDEWCTANCNREPAAYCPPEYCSCDSDIIGVGEAGCADGTREGFTDRKMYPNIAACSGGWSINGLHPSLPAVPQCGRKAGNAPGCQIDGCNPHDICAEGWHVCEHNADVINCAGDAGGCRAGDYSHDGFFATRMSGDYDSKCNPNHGWSNDVFGCGTHGGDVDCKECKGLSKYSHNMCSDLNQDCWKCNDAYRGWGESFYITKPKVEYGGVMCCKDGVDQWGTSEVDISSATFGPVCHGHTTLLACDAGETVHILDAWYGRWDSFTCLPDGWDHDDDFGFDHSSYSPRALAEIILRCEGKLSCSLWAHEMMLGNAGEAAYLMGRYECWTAEDGDVCYVEPAPLPLPEPLPPVYPLPLPEDDDHPEMCIESEDRWRREISKDKGGDKDKEDEWWREDKSKHGSSDKDKDWSWRDDDKEKWGDKDKDDKDKWSDKGDKDDKGKWHSNQFETQTWGDSDKDKADKEKSDKSDKDKDKAFHWHDNDKSECNDETKDNFGCTYGSDDGALHEWGPDCEGKASKLCCPDGYMIQIESAMWGRLDADICHHDYAAVDTDCYMDVTSYAMQECEARQHCTLKIDNGIKGDPCPCTYKYAHGHYRCVPAGDNDRSKVQICHSPTDSARQTLSVSASALGGHMQHGDFLGPCSDSRVMRLFSSKRWTDCKDSVTLQNQWSAALVADLYATIGASSTLGIFVPLKVGGDTSGGMYCDMDVRPNAYPSLTPQPASILSTAQAQCQVSGSVLRSQPTTSRVYLVQDVSSSYNQPQPTRSTYNRRAAYYGAAAGGGCCCGAAIFFYYRRKKRLASEQPHQAIPVSDNTQEQALPVARL